VSGHENGFDFTPALGALITKARERLPPPAACCQRHAMEALIERGARAILETESPGSHRRLGELTVAELMQVLGQPELEAAREALHRTRAAQEATQADAEQLHRDVGALRSPGTLSRLGTAQEASEFFAQLVAAFNEPPLGHTLIVHICWVDRAGQYTAGGVHAPGAN
jgi:hypothetical protein